MIRDYTNFPHRVGDIYRLGEHGGYYILAMVEGDALNNEWLKYALISIDGGNRWIEPSSFAREEERPSDALSEEQFSLVVGEEDREAFVKVQGKVTFVALH